MPALLTAGPFSAGNGEGRELFDGATIELAEGKLTVLDGPSGSGKSTLLRQLTALVETDGAFYELAGESYVPARFPRWRSRVTLAAQDAPMLIATVGENLRFPFAQKCATACVDEGRLAELMQEVGLGGIPLDRDVGTLSGGERHRLALVRGLLWNPSILVADEPFSGLDEETAAVCFDLLRSFAHRPGHAALCVFHERVLIEAADRRIVLGSVAGRDSG